MAASTVPGVVSCEWLKDAIDRQTSDVIVLDVTWFSDKDAKQLYDARHIPGSRFFDIFKGVTNTATHNRNIPSPEVFQEQARAVGVNSDDHVIVYDSIPGKFGLFLGSRAWWMFRLFGHPKVSVLNGGLDKWSALGYETTAEQPNIEAGNFSSTFNSSLIRQFDEMTKASVKQIVDTRPVDAYKGKAEDPKSGHLKGAVSMPFPLTFVDQSTGVLKSPSGLKAAFEASGIQPDQPIVGMCNGGMSSSTAVLSSYLLGIQDSTLYLGGFNEWKQKAPEDRIEQS